VTRLGVAVAQLECAPLDVAENIARTTAAIRSASAGGADLVVLPELVATGYVLDRDALLDRAESTTDFGPALSAWSAAARELGITVVGGFAEQADGLLYNSVAVLGPDGLHAGTYRKLHLFGSERGVFAPGNLGLPVIEVAGISLGLVVCYDLRFPEAVRILALRDVDLVAVPTAWVADFDAVTSPTASIGQVDGALVQGNLNSVFLACADQVGATGTSTFLGRSVVVDPYGRPVAGPLDAQAEGVVVVEIDTDDALRARHRGPGISISPLEDRRTDVYGEFLGYCDPSSDDAAEGLTASALQPHAIL
jgi:N-carbamoylputrescine amidase